MKVLKFEQLKQPIEIEPLHDLANSLNALTALFRGVGQKHPICLHPHAFHHTYATELILQGIDPTHARRLTGHKEEKVFKRYTLRNEQSAAIAAFYRELERT